MPDSDRAVSHLIQSGLVSAEQLEDCQSALGTSAAEEQLLELLIERRLLTSWHAAQIKAGRITGFFLEYYKLLAPLGAGGMGQVFCAEDTQRGRQVAVKVLPRRRATAEMVQRFHREALAALRVHHENIVRTFELAKEGNTHFLVTFRSGKLEFHGRLKSLGDKAALEQLLNKAVRHDWVVYAKRPFSSPACVLKYLARYTHRVALSNRRLVELCEGRVRFRYKDYANDQQSKILSLSSSEFIRRFLMHTLPSGFVRIRYYSFLANRCRNERLEKCRRLLGITSVPTSTIQEAQTPAENSDPLPLPETCPACGRPSLAIIEVVPPARPLPLRSPHFLIHRTINSVCFDTS